MRDRCRQGNGWGGLVVDKSGGGWIRRITRRIHDLGCYLNGSLIQGNDIVRWYRNIKNAIHHGGCVVLATDMHSDSLIVRTRYSAGDVKGKLRFCLVDISVRRNWGGETNRRSNGIDRDLLIGRAAYISSQINNSYFVIDNAVSMNGRIDI